MGEFSTDLCKATLDPQCVGDVRDHGCQQTQQNPQAFRGHRKVRPIGGRRLALTQRFQRIQHLHCGRNNRVELTTGEVEIGLAQVGMDLAAHFAQGFGEILGFGLRECTSP